MPLKKRILNVFLHMPGGDVILDQSLDLHVHVHKDALAPQHLCTVDITNLNKVLREQLLNQFTAWNKRMVERGGAKPNGPNNPYINVTVEAGYFDGSQNITAVIFVGQVVQVSPSGAPPNLAVKIECYTQQTNKLTWTSGRPPPNATFKEYVMWAGKLMQVDNIICETSMNDSRNWNQSASTHIVGDLLIDIQDAYKTDVAAYIDNNVLIVRDKDKIVSISGRVTVKDFIGTPMWTAWGAEFTTLFDPRIILTCAATLESLMNPSLNREFILTSVDYELSSRDVPFYVKANGSPPAK
jgi:hypothetical protein